MGGGGGCWMETPGEGKTAGRRFGCFTTAQSRLGWPLYSCAYRVSDAASLLMCTVPKRLLSSNGRNCKAFISGATGRATGVGCKWRRSSAVCKYRRTAPVPGRGIKRQKGTVLVVSSLATAHSARATITVCKSFSFDTSLQIVRASKCE